MTQETDFKEIRMRAFRANHRDGLLELTLGIPITMFGIGVTTGIESWMMMGNILLPLIVLSMMQIKNAITVPRIGHIEVPRALPMKSQFILLSMMVLFSIGLFVLMGANRDVARQVGQYFPLFIGFGMGTFMLVMAKHYSTKRWQWLGIAFAAASVMLVLIDLPVRKNEGPLLLFMGALMLVTGSVTLAGFIKTSPVLYPKGDQ